MFVKPTTKKKYQTLTARRSSKKPTETSPCRSRPVRLLTALSSFHVGCPHDYRSPIKRAKQTKFDRSGKGLVLENPPSPVISLRSFREQCSVLKTYGFNRVGPNVDFETLTMGSNQNRISGSIRIFLMYSQKKSVFPRVFLYLQTVLRKLSKAFGSRVHCGYDENG